MHEKCHISPLPGANTKAKCSKNIKVFLHINLNNASSQFKNVQSANKMNPGAAAVNCPFAVN